MVRPLAYFGLTFLFTLLLFISLDIFEGYPFALIIIALIVAVLFIILILTGTAFKIKKFIIMAAAVFSALIYLFFFNLIFITGNVVSTDYYITGIVETVSRTAHGTTTAIINTQTSPFLFKGQKTEIAQIPDVEVGERIGCNIVSVENGVSQRRRAYSNGVFAFGIYKDGLVVLETGIGLKYHFQQMQSALSQRISGYLNRQQLSVASAVTLGGRDFLAFEIKNDFTLSGLSHILVVSGLHLSLISSFLLVILRRLFKNRFLLYGLLIAFIIFYVGLTGMRLSVIRAAFVYILISVSHFFYRKSDMYTSLGFCTLCITVFNPYSSIDLSLLLSLFATLGIVFKNEFFPLRLLRTNKVFKRILDAILTTLCATVATLPVFAAIGGGFSLMSVVANLAASVLIAPIILTVLIGLLLSFLPFLPLTSIVFKLSGILIDILLWIAKSISEISWQFIYFNGIFPIIVLGVAFACGFAVFLNGRYRFAAATGFIIAVIGTAAFFSINYNTVRFAIVGNTKNPVVVITKNGKAAVIYRGTKSNNNAVLKYLSKRNLHSINTVIDISHSSSSNTLIAKETSVFSKQKSYGENRLLFDNIEITIKKQSAGNVCIVNCEGFRMAITSGNVDFEGYADNSLLVAGTGKLENVQSQIIFSRDTQSISNFDNFQIINDDDNVVFWLRPGRSIMWER